MPGLGWPSPRQTDCGHRPSVSQPCPSSSAGAFARKPLPHSRRGIRRLPAARLGATESRRRSVKLVASTKTACAQGTPPPTADHPMHRVEVTGRGHTRADPPLAAQVVQHPGRRAGLAFGLPVHRFLGPAAETSIPLHGSDFHLPLIKVQVVFPATTFLAPAMSLHLICRVCRYGWSKRYLGLPLFICSGVILYPAHRLALGRCCRWLPRMRHSGCLRERNPYGYRSG